MLDTGLHDTFGTAMQLHGLQRVAKITAFVKAYGI